MDIETIVTRGLGNATHLVAADDGDAVVVDPPRDAWRILAVAREHGWRITHVLETHVHNDYLSGALELRDTVGSEIVAPARARYEFPHRGVDEGDVLEVGRLRFTARGTPGHTPEHLAWEIRPSDGAGPPTAIATGGSLMIGSAGRTDLLGPATTDELTRAQYQTLRTLAALPPSVRVLPTHGGGSFCSAGPADDRRTSTIAEEVAGNPLLAPMDEETFRRTVLAGHGPYPTYYREMAPINRGGPAVLGEVPATPFLDPEAVERAIAVGAVIIDGREREAFAAAHLPGSLNVELGDTFASTVGWHVPLGTPLVLVLPDRAAAPDEARTELLRIGHDRVVGALRDGVAAWEGSGRAAASYPVVPARAVADDQVDGVMLDIRDPAEWRDDGTIDGALRIPLWELRSRVDELPRDEPIILVCRSGRRAAVAASMLDAADFEVRLVGRGGVPDVLAADAGPRS